MCLLLLWPQHQPTLSHTPQKRRPAYTCQLRHLRIAQAALNKLQSMISLFGADARPPITIARAMLGNLLASLHTLHNHFPLQLSNSQQSIHNEPSNSAVLQ